VSPPRPLPAELPGDLPQGDSELGDGPESPDDQVNDPQDVPHGSGAFRGEPTEIRCSIGECGGGSYRPWSAIAGSCGRAAPVSPPAPERSLLGHAGGQRRGMLSVAWRMVLCTLAWGCPALSSSCAVKCLRSCSRTWPAPTALLNDRKPRRTRGSLYLTRGLVRTIQTLAPITPLLGVRTRNMPVRSAGDHSPKGLTTGLDPKV
jgi:hypothetical protein